MKFKPHNYQEVAKNWIINNPKCGLFLDMGLGKTVTSLTAIELLINDYFDIGKTLVIAPKRVAEDTWPSESKKWDHLEGLKVVGVLGNPKQRESVLQEEADIYIVTRDNVSWLVDYFKGKEFPFDTLIIDELSSFKNHSSQRFKKLKTVTPFFKRVIGLTGTPAPNTYMDLWSQIYLLDRGERLGKNITAFRRDFFNAYSRGMYTEYQLKPGAKEKIDSLISDICISMKAKDYLPDLKDPILIDVKAKLSKKEMEVYKTMSKDALLSYEDETIAALSAAAVTNKLLQLSNGAIYNDNGDFIEIHDKKLDVLEDLIEEAQNENILVFYNFKSDLARINKRFTDTKKLNGEKEIREWNEGKIKILVAHPASAGHGLNLQDGGSIIVWFGLPWSLELYLQANARLQRQGQKQTVRIYRIISENTIDEKVVQVLNGKDIRQEELLQSLKAEIIDGKKKTVFRY